MCYSFILRFVLKDCILLLCSAVSSTASESLKERDLPNQHSPPPPIVTQSSQNNHEESDSETTIPSPWEGANDISKAHEVKGNNIHRGLSQDGSRKQGIYVYRE